MRSKQIPGGDALWDFPSGRWWPRCEENYESCLSFNFNVIDDKYDSTT